MLVQFGVPTDPSEEISVAPVELTGHSEASVQSTYYCPEMMSSAQQPSLQHWKNRCPIGASVGAMTSARNYQVQRLREDHVPPEEPMLKHRFNQWSQKVAVAVSEEPTARIILSVTARIDALAPEVPMSTQKTGQWL